MRKHIRIVYSVSDYVRWCCQTRFLLIYSPIQLQEEKTHNYIRFSIPIRISTLVMIHVFIRILPKLTKMHVLINLTTSRVWLVPNNKFSWICCNAFQLCGLTSLDQDQKKFPLEAKKYRIETQN